MASLSFSDTYRLIYCVKMIACGYSCLVYYYYYNLVWGGPPIISCGASRHLDYDTIISYRGYNVNKKNGLFCSVLQREIKKSLKKSVRFLKNGGLTGVMAGIFLMKPVENYVRFLFGLFGLTEVDLFGFCSVFVRFYRGGFLWRVVYYTLKPP